MFSLLDYHLKIGLVPLRRWLPGKRTGIFNPEFALKNKETALEHIQKRYADDRTTFVDLSFLNKEGMLYDVKDCEAVAKYFRQQEVDAIFLINCNFGCEEAAGKVAQLVGKPVLLWGPRDTIFQEDGTRYTDTQCGLFAIGALLRRYGVPFTYIENCHITDPVFDQTFRKFLAVATMVKNFWKLRILQVGTRVRPFKSVMVNELELLEEFGIDIVPVNMAEVVAKIKVILREKAAALAEDAAKIKEKIDTKDVPEDTLHRMLAFVYLFEELAQEHNASVISTECWTAMQVALEAMPCLAMSVLADKGLIVICESDIYGAITAALLSCAVRGRRAPFFGEFTTRHPENDNAELLWHCGPFPYSLKKKGARAELYNGRPSWQLEDGEYTIARFQADRGNYYLLGGEFRTTSGPYTFGTYLWAQFKDLPQLERKLVEGPYIHHLCEVQGRHLDTLREFCKYVPQLIFDPLEE